MARSAEGPQFIRQLRGSRAPKEAQGVCQALSGPLQRLGRAMCDGVSQGVDLDRIILEKQLDHLLQEGVIAIDGAQRARQLDRWLGDRRRRGRWAAQHLAEDRVENPPGGCC